MEPSSRTRVPPPPDTASAELVDALRDHGRFSHATKHVERLETHISWVLLAGDYAYKIKKPLRLPFLDYSTLESRRLACEEELRLNRRTAPDLYLGVVAITGPPWAPRLDGDGPAIEYAVKMRRFAQDALFSRLARSRSLDGGNADALADAVAALHEAAARSSAAPSPALAALANFREIAAILGPARARAEPLDALRAWTGAEAARLDASFERRLARGFVRECHGDLHLNNVVRHGGRPVLFDCIEFSEALRLTDVIADVAFASMDFARLGMPRLRRRFLNRYFERTGDYEGIELLRFYEVYRAMVRSKVAAIRLRQAAADTREQDDAGVELAEGLALAQRLARTAAPVLVVMQGLSGSGKTTVSQRLVEALGAVRVRSDVERKRLHGLEADVSAASAPGEGIYGEAGTRATYDRLAQIARLVLASGRPVIVDAAFLRRAERDRFRAIAAEAGAGFQLFACTAPPDVLRSRVAGRAGRGGDASDAGVAVLEAQLAHAEPLGAEELQHATLADTHVPYRWKAAAESLGRRFGGQAG